MADLGNQKIKNTYQFVLQADGSGNVQKLDGTTPSLIFNSPITYNVGTPQAGLVLKSDATGGVSWGAVTFSGDVYISGGSIVGDTIELKPSSGGTLSIPGLSFSANSNGTIGNAPRNKNVGIGTPTPNEPLTVVGNISASTNVYSNNLVLKANAGGTSFGQITPDVNHGTIKFMTKPPGTADNGESLIISQDLIEAKASPGTGTLVSYMKLQPADGGQDIISFNDANNDIDFAIKSDNVIAFKLDAAKDMMAFRDYVGIGYSADKWPTNNGSIAGTPTYQLRVAGKTLLSGLTTPLTVVGDISATTIIQGSEFNSKSITGYKINNNKLLWVDGGDTQLGNASFDTDILGTTINLHSITSGGTMNLSQKLGVSGKTFLGTIDAAGDSYTNDKILVAQSNGEVEYLTTAQLKADIGDEDYWTASTTGGHIINSGLTSNVGIGTDKPNEKLTVFGSMSASTSIHSGNWSQSTNYIKYKNDNRIFFPDNDTSSIPNILYGFWGMLDSGVFSWGTGEDMKIYHTGSAGLIDNNTGSLTISSSEIILGDAVSEVEVRDNLKVNDDLTVNNDNLYVHSTNERVGIKALNPDALLTVSGDSSTGFTAYNLNGGNATFSNGFTRVRFNNGANTNDLSPGDQLQVVDANGDTYIVSVNTVNDGENIFLAVSFPGETINATSFNYNGAPPFSKLFKVYNGVNPSFQVSGDTVMSGTTDLLDIFSRVGMSGTVTSVAISGTDGIDVDSGSPITDSGTITLGLSSIDATKIANGSVTNTEFQYINTLSSNAQTQLDAKLPLAGGTMAGAIAMGTNKITALGEGTDDSDAVTKGYVDTQDIANRYWSATTTGGHIVNSGLTGNVGIGTDTPSALLDVKGTTNITQRLGVSGETAVGGAVHTSTSFVVGNATLTTSELDISSGNFTLDVEGDITIDANGADIILSDDGTDFGRFKRDTSDFVIKSETNNKDILFKGQDAGGTITALQLDMSEAGTAIFNHDIVIADDGFIGSASDTDAIQIEADGDVVLSQGLTVTQITNFLSAARLGDATKIQFGAGYDAELYVSGDDFYIDQTTSDKDIIFKGTDGASDITALTLDMSEAGKAIFNAGATFGAEVAMGTNKITGVGDPTAAQDVTTKTYVENNGRYIQNTTFSLKILSSNNWVGFNASTGGLNSSGFFNTDTGASSLVDLYSYYDDNSNVFFMVPYAGKIQRLVIQGGFSAGGAVNDNVEVELAKASVSDGGVKGSWSQVTGFTKTLPDSNSKRFIWDAPNLDTSVSQYDVFLLAFKGEDSINNFITASVIMEFTYTIT